MAANGTKEKAGYSLTKQGTHTVKPEHNLKEAIKHCPHKHLLIKANVTVCVSLAPLEAVALVSWEADVHTAVGNVMMCGG